MPLLSDLITRLRAGEPGADAALRNHLAAIHCTGNPVNRGARYEGIHAAVSALRSNAVPLDECEDFIKWKIALAVKEQARADSPKIRVPRSTKSYRKKQGLAPYRDLECESPSLRDRLGRPTGDALHFGGSRPRDSDDAQLRKARELRAALRLTDTEADVLSLLEQGYSDREASEMLGVDAKATRKHLQNKALQHALRATDDEITVLKLSRAGYSNQQIDDSLAVDSAVILSSLTERALRFGYQI